MSSGRKTKRISLVQDSTQVNSAAQLTQKVILGPRAVRGHADDWHHVGVGVAVLAVAIVAVVDGNAIATVADTTAVAEDVVAGGRLRVAVTQAGIDDDVA